MGSYPPTDGDTKCFYLTCDLNLKTLQKCWTIFYFAMDMEQLAINVII